MRGAVLSGDARATQPLRIFALIPCAPAKQCARSESAFTEEDRIVFVGLAGQISVDRVGDLRCEADVR
jgi:hypothetical protein